MLWYFSRISNHAWKILVWQNIPVGWDSEHQGWSQPLLLISCVTLGVLGGTFNLAELQFFICQMGIIFGLLSQEGKFKGEMK